MRSKGGNKIRQGVSALVVLALVMLGFGHQWMRQAALQDAQVRAELAALGLSPDDLCLTGYTHTDQDHTAQPDCPVCLLGKSLLPAPSLTCPTPVRVVVQLFDAVAYDAPVGAQGPRAPPARGPPAFS